MTRGQRPGRSDDAPSRAAPNDGQDFIGLRIWDALGYRSAVLSVGGSLDSNATRSSAHMRNAQADCAWCDENGRSLRTARAQ